MFAWTLWRRLGVSSLQFWWEEWWMPAEPCQVQGAWWLSPSCRGAWLPVCGVALQITVQNWSTLEIIPVFLRIKLNPDHSSEQFTAQSPAKSFCRSQGGSNLLHRSIHLRAGSLQVFSAAKPNNLDMHSLMVEERLAFISSNFYLSHCLLIFFAWNHLTIFNKRKKLWKSGACRYPHLQRTILSSSSK